MARPIRVAAAGDVHCDEVNRDEIERAFARVEGEVDAILLAGDLTTYGELEQGELLAEICAPLETPIYAVLGNHDWHCNQAAELDGRARGRRRADDRPRPRDPGARRRDASGSPARRASSAASPTRRCRTSASRCCAQVYAETTAEVERARRGPRRDRGLRLPDRSPALRAHREHARRRAARHLRLPRLRPAGRRRSSSTTRTWRSTDTRTSAPSRARSATCRCTTSPCPRWRATSSSSSSTAARCESHEPRLRRVVGRAGFAGVRRGNDRSTLVR